MDAFSTDATRRIEATDFFSIITRPSLPASYSHLKRGGEIERFVDKYLTGFYLILEDYDVVRLRPSPDENHQVSILDIQSNYSSLNSLLSHNVSHSFLHSIPNLFHIHSPKPLEVVLQLNYSSPFLLPDKFVCTKDGIKRILR